MLPPSKKLHGEPLPVDPVEQNRAWYRLYKTVENDHAVRQVHRDFLLLRDYTALSAVFIVFFGGAGLYAVSSVKVGLSYLVLLLAQYAIVRQAAFNYGVRMVTTVLARRTAKDEAEHSEDPKKTSQPQAQARGPRNTVMRVNESPTNTPSGSCGQLVPINALGSSNPGGTLLARRSERRPALGR